MIMTQKLYWNIKKIIGIIAVHIPNFTFPSTNNATFPRSCPLTLKACTLVTLVSMGGGNIINSKTKKKYFKNNKFDCNFL